MDAEGSSAAHLLHNSLEARVLTYASVKRRLNAFFSLPGLKPTSYRKQFKPLSYRPVRGGICSFWAAEAMLPSRKKFKMSVTVSVHRVNHSIKYIPQSQCQIAVKLVYY